MTKKILVTDCWTRKALCAVRALGAAGFEVHVVTHTRLSPALYSKFAKKSFLVPFAKKNPARYAHAILEILKGAAYDCLMAMEDDTLRALLDARTEIEEHTAFPVPLIGDYQKADDKWQTLELARALGVPAPRSMLGSSAEEALAFAGDAGFPLILKPRSSSGSRGLRKVHTEKELLAALEELTSLYGAPVVQECIAQKGEGAGVGVLCDHGKPVASFSYKRLREYPVNGGPGTLRESTNDTVIQEYAARLLKALNWHGVAMVEFKFDPKDGIPKLMEINPRFWGSLHLSYVAGVNFPLLLHTLAVGGLIGPQQYTVGVRSRWLIPGDIMHFLANPRRFHLRPSFFDFFEPHTFYDQWMRGDMRGNIAVILCTAVSVFDPAVWRAGVFRK
jgi:predicted ATP-grasp superfamily ATP-dependent carboligase